MASTSRVKRQPFRPLPGTRDLQGEGRQGAPSPRPAAQPAGLRGEGTSPPSEPGVRGDPDRRWTPTADVRRSAAAREFWRTWVCRACSVSGVMRLLEPRKELYSGHAAASSSLSHPLRQVPQARLLLQPSFLRGHSESCSRSLNAGAQVPLDLFSFPTSQ